MPKPDERRLFLACGGGNADTQRQHQWHGDGAGGDCAAIPRQPEGFAEFGVKLHVQG